MATRSNLEGVAELTKQLIALGKLDDGKALRSAIRAGMKPVLSRAQALIPKWPEPHRLSATYGKMLVMPGYAATTLHIVTKLNSQKNVADAILGVNKFAFYAVQFVELGTRYQSAQPWLTRALSEARSDAEAAIRDSLQKAVLKATKV